MSGNPPADFRDEHAARNIIEYMLFGSQRGKKDRDGKQEGKASIKQRYIFSVANANITEPAYQTMNGGKEVVCGIYCVQKTHQMIPYTTARYLRSCVCSRKDQKAEKADTFGKHIGSEKTIGSLFILPDDEDIIKGPEKIADKINTDRPGEEGNLKIQSGFEIIVV